MEQKCPYSFVSRGGVLDAIWLYIKSQLTNARVQYTIIMGRYDSHNTEKKLVQL